MREKKKARKCSFEKMDTLYVVGWMYAINNRMWKKRNVKCKRWCHKSQ